LHFLDVPWSDDVLNHQEKIGDEIHLNPKEFSTSQVKEKVNEKALTTWFGCFSDDILEKVDKLAPMLRKLGYNTSSDRPSYEEFAADDFYEHDYIDLLTFCYDYDDDTTFKDWLKRYGPVINDRGSSLPDERKRNLLLDKLDRHAYKTYSDYVLPQEPQHIDLAATVDKLTKLFGPKQTLTRRRFEFLQSTCEPLTTSHVPYRDFSNKIKKKFEDASMKDVDDDSLKCLVFLSGLTDPSHSDVRLRLLNRLNCLKEDDASPSLADFANDCETFVALRSDNRTMESKGVNAAHYIKPSGMHRRRPSRNVMFRHRSTTRQPRQEPTSTSTTKRTRFSLMKSRFRQRNIRCNNPSSATQNARTYLKVEINGFSTRLQLDTGSDVTMISRRTWSEMGSPTISRAAVPVKKPTDHKRTSLDYSRQTSPYLTVTRESQRDKETATSPRQLTCSD
uniref:Protein-tyrosine sulfotransferase n=1 Tax=Heligmosomoides polygyrus TaxID=6339 RepID=A0A183GN38_HELPZ